MAQVQLWDVLQVHAYGYITVASTILWVYEYLITLDKEVRFIWSRPMSLGKISFYMIRYFPFATGSAILYITVAHTSETATSLDRCHIVFVTLSCFIFFEDLVAYGLLLIRVYAVWKSECNTRSIKVKIICGAVVTSYFLYTAGSAYIEAALIQGQERWCPDPLQRSAITTKVILAIRLDKTRKRQICIHVTTNDRIWIAYVLRIVLEMTVLCLLVAKAIINRRHAYFRNGLLDVMIKDVNIFILRDTSEFIRDCLPPLQGFLHCILTNRMQFHICAVNEERTQLYPPGRRQYVLADLRAVKTSGIGAKFSKSRFIWPLKQCRGQKE
ncbi:hypothetical protein SCHPADRAFT_927310 [Schizopora paradoxa]|uniref:DUF6533 domain-containing protein n=1 Tax=Schizopora paradoxa TaxID=27342 RepID=A0A0H2SE03_9AGAM|nr:hypothetical protein SCHPADRAFT_927310 [Schizopora paradoxa]